MEEVVYMLESVHFDSYLLNLAVILNHHSLVNKYSFSIYIHEYMVGTPLPMKK